MHTDVAIIGAGPIGIELACALRREGVDYLHFEEKQIGATLMWWAPGTRFFSSPERLEIAGIPLVSLDQSKATREEYLAYLRQVTLANHLDIRRFTRIERIEPAGRAGAGAAGGYTLTTRRLGATAVERIQARRVVLAIGNMHAPRLIGVPGETDRPDVSHYLDDPHTYFGRRLLIVGGKNSAVEAAIRCYRAGAHVTMSYRQAEFDRDRIKYWLLPELEWLISKGRIGFLPQTCPIAFEDGATILQPLDEEGAPVPGAGPIRHTCDFTLLLTGYIQDQSLFDQLNLERMGDERKPKVDPATMEASSPGVYVAGTAAGGSQRRARVFIETSHVHVDRIAAALTGKPPPSRATDDHSDFPEA